MPVALVLADLGFESARCDGCGQPLIGASTDRPSCPSCSRLPADRDIAKALAEWERNAA